MLYTCIMYRKSQETNNNIDPIDPRKEEYKLTTISCLYLSFKTNIANILDISNWYVKQKP